MTVRRPGLAQEVPERLVNRQGRWHEVRRRVADAAASPRRASLHPAVAISRQAGAGGASLARLLGARLGWQVLDREILDDLAAQLRLDRETLQLLDETHLNWFDESIVALIQPRVVSQDEYVGRLVKLVVLALAEGPGVIVGRGAHAFLPAQTTVAIRVVAEEGDRIARMASVLDVDEKAARRWVHDTDTARAAFLRQHFRDAGGDPLAYDLVLNTSRTPLQECADVVVTLCRARGLAPVRGAHLASA